MFTRLFGPKKKNVFTIKSKLLLLGTPYYYSDEAQFVFNKPESARFRYLLELTVRIHSNVLNNLIAQNKTEMSSNIMHSLKVSAVVISRILQHIEVLNGDLSTLDRNQFKKYVEDINDTLNILESLDSSIVEYLQLLKKPEVVNALPDSTSIAN